jgi:DNA-directed RNA polymerase specialized sigma24 family protein
LTSDPYYRALEGKYFEQKSDDELAEELNCDVSTVWRNRGRLVTRLAIRLYGVDAV